MTSNELVDSVSNRLASLESRVEAAFARLDDEAANRPLPPSNWSAYQILDHLMKTNAPYIPALKAAIAAAPDGGDQDATFSWFGKLLIKAAGPGGNAPAHKQLIPAPGPLTKDTLTAYLAQAKEVADVFRSAKGRDLGKTRFNNPFMKLFRMTLADALELTTVHIERHVGQIEAA